MKLFNPKTRITMGLIGIMISFVMVAFLMDIIPDREKVLREKRAALAETIAVYCTALVRTNSIGRLRDDFNLLAERNIDLLSLALRHESGNLFVAIGEHGEHWEEMPGQYSKNAQVRVPIMAGNEKWGELELRFESFGGKRAWFGFLNNPMLRIILFLGLSCFVVFYYYLGKVLRQLDPSQAIPGRVREALDTMAEGLLILDRKEHIVLANTAFSMMIDKPPDELQGYLAGELPWMDTTGEKLQASKRPWVRSLIHGKVQKDNIIRLQISDNESRTFKTNCSPVLGESGKYAGVLVSLDDITELEEKEIELTNSKQAAEEANKAKSTFLANMSHEIRTPMNAILGFTEILKRGYIKNEKESLRYLSTIHSSGKNLLELINDILDLSKVESGLIEIEKLKVAPYATVHEVMQMLAAKANEKCIYLDFKADGKLPKEIETDPVRLRQIIFNLIGNAIKFTGEGGVAVTCRYTDKGPKLMMDITDTGIGMSPDGVKNIFDPFVQADSSVTRRFGGTGLGLAISRKFAQAMGGDITVTSELGKGSIFTVSITTGDLSGTTFLQPEDVVLLQEEISFKEDDRWQFHDANVLVVDDGAENRELVKLLLEDAGLTVDEAKNGQIGVKKAFDGDYSAILMDVNMPVMDGFTAVGILREKGVTVPVIALTASAMKGFEEECLAAGYSGYLSKPINIDLFMEMMAKLLGGRRKEKEDVGSFPVSEFSHHAVQEGKMVLDDSPIVSSLPASNQKFREIITRFVDRLHTQLDAIEAAAARGDMNEVTGIAHWLKGSGGTVGFQVFTEPAAQLEIDAKNENAFEVKKSIESLRLLAARIVVQNGESTTIVPDESAAPTEKDPLSSPSVTSVPQSPVVSRLAANKRFKPVIIKFLEKLDVQVKNMEDAVKNEDMDGLSGLAHWLKGSGGTVGYDDFTEIAENLETCAKAGDKNMAVEVFEKIKTLVAAIVPPLDENNGTKKNK
jgi:signal transduction histidine kinase/DNA-binding response OmpR family regulator